MSFSQKVNFGMLTVSVSHQCFTIQTQKSIRMSTQRRQMVPDGAMTAIMADGHCAAPHVTDHHPKSPHAGQWETRDP